MSAFTERHGELIALVKLSKLSQELNAKVHESMLTALESPTPEAVTEVLRTLREYELVKSELREELAK